MLFVAYRLLVAAYTVTMTFVSMRLHTNPMLPWPVWLTNWSYLLLTCHLLCAAVIVLLRTCFDQLQPTVPYSVLSASRSSSVPRYMKLSWFLFTVACPAAIGVTSVYFAAVFPQRHRDYLNAEDINLHVMNTMLVVLEYTLSAFPVRLLHLVYLWCYASAYVIFSAIYWAFDHSRVMYPGVLDWNTPARTGVVLAVLAFVGLPMLQFILFGVYQLRKYIYNHCACRQSND